MIQHFFKIFIRTSLKNSTYSFINIIGLVLGMTTFTLITLYVWHEKSYDEFHIKKNQVFRVRQDRYSNGELDRQWSGGPMGIGADLKNNFSEVQRFVRLHRGVNEYNVIANEDNTQVTITPSSANDLVTFMALSSWSSPSLISTIVLYFFSLLLNAL